MTMILLDYPDGFSAKELLERLEVVPPTDFEKSEYLILLRRECKSRFQAVYGRETRRFW
jgi:hypothetical protein